MAARDASARFPLNNCCLSFGTADKRAPKPRAGSGPGQTNVPYAGVYLCAGGGDAWKRQAGPAGDYVLQPERSQ